MVLPASDIVLSSQKNSCSSLKSVEIYNELDVIMAGEDFHELQIFPVEEQRDLIGKEGRQKEKHISVDPVSLRELALFHHEASFNLMLPPVAASAERLRPLIKPAKSQLTGCSLPNSACSSPRFSFGLLKKKWKNESQASPRQIDKLAGRDSAAHSFPALQQSINMRRSQFCAEGRSPEPADELDLWFSKCTATESDDRHHGNFLKTEATRDNNKSAKNMDLKDDGFKCGALCLYLPGFAKGKPVKSQKEEVTVDIGSALSRSVSPEKFECGSWASPAIANDHEGLGSGSTSLYFDLPLELIQTGRNNEASLPVATGFIFDKDSKGILKNSSTRAASPRKSHESSRHVRFSTSSPSSPASCITPRLRKAREDFNAFLEAQSV